MATGHNPTATSPVGGSQAIAEMRALRDAAQSLENAVEGLASKEYVEELQREEDRKRKRFGLLVVVIGVCFVLLFLLMSVGLYQISQIAHTNRANTNQLIECNSPSLPGERHECFEREQAAIGQAIDEVVRKISEQMSRQHRQMGQ